MAYKQYFTAETLEELKKQYRQLSKKFHPDVNPAADAEKIFIAIHAEYELLFARLKNVDKKAYQHKEDANDRTYRNIIDALVRFAQIDIDIVGSWIWVSGDTYSIKGELKKLGLKWSKSNSKWFYGHFSGKKKDILTWEEKVEKYGCDNVQKATKPAEKVLLSSK